MDFISLLTPTNIIFVLVMFVITVIALIKYNNEPAKLKTIAPFLIGIGVLGTFWGIFIALMDFDAAHIQESIAGLLEGLKTAFITSLVGMILSLIANAISQFSSSGNNQRGSNPLETLINLQRESIAKQDELARSNNSHLKMIEKALIGDGESTLLTQIQKLRTNMQDGFDRTEIKLDKMVNSFETFATKMAENNYNALIMALREVIADFNAKINEQFGENFKHLNEGVGKMLDWQDNYRMSIEIQTKALEDTISGIECVANSFEIVVERSEKFSEVAETLETLLTELNTQRDELADKMNEFSDIGKSARNAFVEIDSKVNEMVDTISKSIKSQNDRTNKIIKLNEESLISQSDKFAEMQKSMSQTISVMQAKNIELSSEITGKTAEAVTDFKSKMNELQTNYNESLRKVISDNSGITSDFLKKNSDELAVRFGKFQELLDKELEKSLTALGNQLASLSGHFVKDYSPLTNQLRNVLTIAEGLQNGTYRN
ncbi:MAG: MotA/TolQ/ExbB proton channel family protein [Candidatus Kapabacteria bacterium]|nr:MotA/TolQ/ExbB proton channel family protein [Ignavibacteriota bacterium]MCW5883409.1 MotA/TolQ/ExbB proton channel family protein [Candidatus Kapabacteria bacterium]